MTKLNVFFESLGKTFSVEPVGPLFPRQYILGGRGGKG